MKQIKKLLLGIITIAAMAVLCAVCAGAEKYGDYKYSVLADGTVEITDYVVGSATTLSIPAEINGKRVTSISDMAFYGSSVLTSITIPDSVSSIGEEAFSYCSGITSITIPNSVTSIGNWAFSHCYDLTSITISDSLTSIGEGTFYDCYGLKSITIPGSVTSIGGYAFYECSGLTSITIPDSVTSIGDQAFNRCSGLTSITIPKGVTNIGNSVFSECSGLTSITIPDSVTSIGDYSFLFCSGLTSITIPDSVTSIGELTFSGCYGLTSVTIPDSVTSIGDRAFEGCTGLTSITIPGSVTSIGDNSLGYKNMSAITGYEKIPGFKIYCYSGTAGETYAKDNGFDYELLDAPKVSAVSGFKLGGRAADALRLNWTKNTSADGYIIEKYDGTKWVRIAKITSNATVTYRVTGLSAGTAYKFRMKAYKTSGSTAAYSAYTSTLAARTNPSNVTGFKLGGRASNALRLNWNKNASADGYIIEQYKGGKWVRIAKIASNATTTYRVTGLSAGTAYKFRMKSYKMSGSTALYSGYTATLAARTNPSNVTGLKIGGRASDALRLDWNKNTSADGYIVEMYKGGKWVRIKKLASNSTITLRVGTLAKNTTYKFRIKAYKMSGTTALYSGYVTVSGKTAA